MEGTDYRNAIEIDDESLSGRDISDMQADIQNIVSGIYMNQAWVR